MEMDWIRGIDSSRIESNEEVSVLIHSHTVPTSFHESRADSEGETAQALRQSPDTPLSSVFHESSAPLVTLCFSCDGLKRVDPFSPSNGLVFFFFFFGVKLMAWWHPFHGIAGTALRWPPREVSQWKWRSCRRKPAGGSWFSRNRDVVKIPFSPHEFKMNPGFGMPPGAWLYEILYFDKPLGLIRWWSWMKAPIWPPICSAQIVPGVRPSCRLFAYVSGHRAPGEGKRQMVFFFCVSTPEVLVRLTVFFCSASSSEDLA